MTVLQKTESEIKSRNAILLFLFLTISFLTQIFWTLCPYFKNIGTLSREEGDINSLSISLPTLIEAVHARRQGTLELDTSWFTSQFCIWELGQNPKLSETASSLGKPTLQLLLRLSETIELVLISVWA